jgi:glycosyltransferase involved in cell wall biosynthesis
MKIIIVNEPWNQFTPPQVNRSVDIIIYEQARRLAKNDQGQIFVYMRGERWSQQITHQHVQYLYPNDILNQLFRFFLKVLTKISPVKFWTAHKPMFASQIIYFFYGLNLALQVRKRNIDIVHIHSCSQFIPIVRYLNPGVKIILQTHSEWLSKLDYDLLEPRLSKVDSIINCSDFLTNALKARFPHLAHRCHTVYNGVDTGMFQRSEPTTKPLEAKPLEDLDRPRRLLYTGRISPEKGIHILLEAFEKVHAQMPNVELELVGAQAMIPLELLINLDDDPEILALSRFYPQQRWQDYLETWQMQSPAASQVSFVGRLNHGEISQRYQSADLLVFPSVCNEAFGMPVAEAMASGLPVVVTQTGALPELVGYGKQGYIANVNDAKHLAETIIQALRISPAERQQKSAAAHYKTCQEFDWKPVIEKLSKIYYC